MPDKTFYIATPIFYVNGAPHLGHAYTSIAADVMARWKRLDGYDVLFATGTDEHGGKVEKAALDAGMAPQDFTDLVSAKFRDLGRLLDLSNDVFIRTTEQRHAAACQDIWRRLRASGDIYLGTYEGWYAVRDETFYAADEVAPGPDGTRLAPTGAPVEWVTEESYFFRLSAWGDRLMAYYDAAPDRILPPSRRNEVTSFVRGGLKDLAVSRTGIRWGVPVPDDPKHVMYVWLDALINYITICGFPNTTDALWRFWPTDINVVGKDILRFHAVIWPAVLLAAGLEPPLRVVGHGWWTARGEKMSKSVGNAIDGVALVETYGLDAVRFFVLREVPFGNDGDFSDAAVIRRLNGELANDLGNLAQRTLSQIAKNLGGILPEREPATDDDRQLRDAADALAGALRPMMDRMALGDALEEVWKVIRSANAYVDHQAPWALRKSDPARMAAVLRVLVDVLRVVATVLTPFMPASMSKLLDQLAVSPEERSLDALATPLPGGRALPAPQGIFPRFVTEAAQ
ncbi:MAG: methionine--tRNA ligase [Pseudomonadota bacterium]|nr:methionine--tRNA ligase [Pseudomonadota bacterium]